MRQLTDDEIEQIWQAVAKAMREIADVCRQIRLDFPELVEAVRQQQVEPGFHEQLISLINRCGMDNYCDTPDFILGDFVMKQLEAYRAAILARDRWAGRETVGYQISSTS